jgi:hypothetical protein
VEGSAGKPATAVALDHGDRPGPMPRHPWVRVVSWRTPRSAAQRALIPARAEECEALAWRGLFTLINVTAPEFEEQGRWFWRNAMIYLSRRSSRCASWSPALWSLDGQTVRARFARFAGGWTGYLLEPGVVVVAVGISPHQLGLSRIRTGTTYHFPLDEPIDHPDTIDASAQAALGAHAETELPRRVHADHRKLLGRPLADSPQEKSWYGICAAPGCEQTATLMTTVAHEPVELFGASFRPGLPLALCAAHESALPAGIKRGITVTTRSGSMSHPGAFPG